MPVIVLGVGLSTSTASAASAAPDAALDASSNAEATSLPTVSPPTDPEETPIHLSPVEEPDYGLSALVPDGWTDQGHGTYTRSESSSDPADHTLLALQSAPLSASALWPTLEKQLGLTAVPDPVDTRETPALRWTLYHIEVPSATGAIAVDLGLAESGGRTWIVMLQSGAADSALLHDEVMLPVLDAFAPLVAPSPSPGSQPYDSLDVTFPGGADGVTLAGTLTLPPATAHTRRSCCSAAVGRRIVMSRCCR